MTWSQHIERIGSLSCDCSYEHYEFLWAYMEEVQGDDVPFEVWAKNEGIYIDAALLDRLVQKGFVTREQILSVHTEMHD